MSVTTQGFHHPIIWGKLLYVSSNFTLPKQNKQLFTFPIVYYDRSVCSINTLFINEYLI